MDKLLQSNHLPFQLPDRKYSLVQKWKYLTFMHWRVSPKILSHYLPEGIELDLYEGNAYVGLIPFLMKDVHPRLLFPINGISNFPEFNIRTYVKVNNKPGVYHTIMQWAKLQQMKKDIHGIVRDLSKVMKFLVQVK